MCALHHGKLVTQRDLDFFSRVTEEARRPVFTVAVSEETVRSSSIAARQPLAPNDFLTDTFTVGHRIKLAICWGIGLAALERLPTSAKRNTVCGD